MGGWSVVVRDTDEEGSLVHEAEERLQPPDLSFTDEGDLGHHILWQEVGKECVVDDLQAGVAADVRAERHGGCVGVDLDLQQALREHDELVLPPHRLGVGVGVVRDEDAVVEPEAGELDHHVRERGVAREEDAAADAEASELPVRRVQWQRRRPEERG